MTEFNNNTEQQTMDTSQEPLLPAVRMTTDLMRRMGASHEIAELCGRAVGKQTDGSVCLPVTESEAALLQDSTLISRPEAPHRPFVLDGRRLYTRRNWTYEQTVLNRVLGMARQESLAAPAIPADTAFEHLKECQKQAVAMMASRRFSILTGGPGTGKTYTIARAVKLVTMQPGNESLRLGLAAPTGKAAARVKEAMMSEAQALGLDGPMATSTIHALLGSTHDLVTFRHNHDNPLPLDWLVIDEASMIDLPLMAKLLDALPDSCRLTLVGDANQLASVEPGRVFGDLCAMPAIPKTELTESTRFPSGGEIARLADAVNGGLAQDTLSLLSSTTELVRYIDLAKSVADSPAKWPGFTDAIKAHFSTFAAQRTPEGALQSLNDCRVLCVLHHGPYGMNRLNAIIRSLLGDSCPIPMMVTKNNSTLHVHNGDVGVIMPGHAWDADGIRMLWLQGEDGAVRAIPLDLLPDSEMAFASTIHKSQGSEFKDVIIILPPFAVSHDGQNDNPLLTREILYTAITRTRKTVLLYGGDESIACCCNHVIERDTGLRYPRE